MDGEAPRRGSPDPGEATMINRQDAASGRTNHARAKQDRKKERAGS
jgi:hypothetical protein